MEAKEEKEQKPTPPMPSSFFVKKEEEEEQKPTPLMPSSFLVKKEEEVASEKKEDAEFGVVEFDVVDAAATPMTDAQCDKAPDWSQARSSWKANLEKQQAQPTPKGTQTLTVAAKRVAKQFAPGGVLPGLDQMSGPPWLPPFPQHPPGPPSQRDAAECSSAAKPSLGQFAPGGVTPCLHQMAQPSWSPPGPPYPPGLRPGPCGPPPATPGRLPPHLAEFTPKLWISPCGTFGCTVLVPSGNASLFERAQPKKMPNKRTVTAMQSGATAKSCEPQHAFSSHPAPPWRAESALPPPPQRPRFHPDWIVPDVIQKSDSNP